MSDNSVLYRQCLPDMSCYCQKLTMLDSFVYLFVVVLLIICNYMVEFDIGLQ